MPRDITRLLRRPVEVDEQKLAAQRARGNRVEQLLREEPMQEAFKTLEAVYLGLWRQSDPLDIETRERAHLAVRILDELRNHLISVVRDGEAAGARIEKELRRA